MILSNCCWPKTGFKHRDAYILYVDIRNVFVYEYIYMCVCVCVCVYNIYIYIHTLEHMHLYSYLNYAY